jgi:phosphatidylserine/phosphatidylglycerophosphate/cardiolipin synthase-like enzyme
MKKIFTFLVIVIVFLQLTFAQKTGATWPMKGLVKVYFTQPVDNTFSNGINATYLNNVVFDTLAAYINRAKYTVDICQYEYETWTGDPIYTAINNAYARGVKVRYIQDGSYASKNTGVAKLNSSIHVIASPTSTGYGICHNKFVIIDEYATDTTKAVVISGSPDWTSAMSQGDYNNLIIFQSKVLARAYTSEFNIMWGDTTHGGVTNSTASKFGPNKPSWGSQHTFYIGGSAVDLYFSPTDGVESHIESTINSANVDLYCGMFTFTETTAATDIVNRKNAGAYAAAILDNYSSGGYTPYTTTLPNGLGGNFVGYTGSYLYHNKYLIVNPSAPCDDPKVLTGSHNWTSSANSTNDENTVIVHNDTIANLYLQSFAGDFKAIKGSSLTHTVNPCPTGINEINPVDADVYIYPNPVIEGSPVYLSISPSLNLTDLKLVIYDILGNKLKEITHLTSQQNAIDCGIQAKGMYFFRLLNNDKLIKTGKFLYQ